MFLRGEEGSSGPILQAEGPNCLRDALKALVGAGQRPRRVDLQRAGPYILRGGKRGSRLRRLWHPGPGGVKCGSISWCGLEFVNVRTHW